MLAGAIEIDREKTCRPSAGRLWAFGHFILSHALWAVYLPLFRRGGQASFCRRRFPARRAIPLLASTVRPHFSSCSTRPTPLGCRSAHTSQGYSFARTKRLQAALAPLH